MGPRWWISGLPLDLEPQYTLTEHISKLNDTPTGAMTVPRLTIRIKKWAVAQFLEIPVPS